MLPVALSKYQEELDMLVKKMPQGIGSTLFVFRNFFKGMLTKTFVEFGVCVTEDGVYVGNRHVYSSFKSLEPLHQKVRDNGLCLVAPTFEAEDSEFSITIQLTSEGLFFGGDENLITWKDLEEARADARKFPRKVRSLEHLGIVTPVKHPRSLNPHRELGDGCNQSGVKSEK